MTANFDHVVQLHRKEMGRSIKCARTNFATEFWHLSQLSEHKSSWATTSSMTTINGLIHVQGEEKNENQWTSTAEFMGVIRHFWLCVTV